MRFRKGLRRAELYAEPSGTSDGQRRKGLAYARVVVVSRLARGDSVVG